MIRRWLPSSSTKRRISDFLKHRTSLHDTAARQQLTVNCSSRGYARMIEAHADPRSEALCRRPEARRWSSEHRRNETRERVERRTREMQNRTVRARRRGAAVRGWRARRPRARACAGLFRTWHRPATAFRLAAAGPRSQEQEDDPVEVLYMPTPVPKYSARSRFARTSHLSHTQHTTLHRLDRPNTPQCACAAPRPPMHEPQPVPPSPTVSSAGVRARLHAPAPRPGGRGPGPAQ